MIIDANLLGKVCHKCHKWKSYKNFHKWEKNKDGHGFICKPCIKEYQQKNKDRINKRRRELYRERRK